MSTVKNIKQYDEKESMNVRLQPELKARLKDEAKDKNVSVSALLNEILESRYNNKK